MPLGNGVPVGAGVGSRAIARIAYTRCLHEPVAAVERALDILEAFKPGDDVLSLAILSDRTGLFKSTILRLAATLERYGYLSRLQNGGYGVSYKPLTLGSLFQRSLQSPDTVMPILESLVQATGESASFMVREGNVRVCLYRIESPQAVRVSLRAGDVKPLNRGAAGRILLAFAEPKNATGNVERAEMIATSVAEITPGVTSIAAPVFGPGDVVAGALSVSGPSHRLGLDVLKRMRTVLLTAARGLTASIGGDAERFVPALGHQKNRVRRAITG